MVNPVSSIRPQHFAHISVGALVAVIYGFLATRSKTPPAGADLFDFLGGYWCVAAVIVVYWFWLRASQVELSFKSVFLWAVLFRLIGVWGSPILEDDFYRYLLDGCLFVSTGSPYGIAPSSLFIDNTLSPACEATLSGVNNPDLATIYAPLLQYVFGLSHLLSPSNINILQLIMVIFDLTVIWLLGRCAPASHVLLYAWCPLALKEFAFTAHPDVIGACLLLAAFIARKNSRTAVACMLVGLAICAKIFALLALPFFLYRQPLRYWGITFGTIALLYSPFLLQGQTDMPVLGIFVEHWNFNPFLFDLVRVFLSDLPARVLCAVLFLTWLGFYFIKYNRQCSSTEIPRMDWVFGMFLLFSPVVNPWYLVWLLPYAALRPSCWAWAASIFVSLSYVTGLNLADPDLHAYQVAAPARIIEMAGIAIALLIDYRRGGFRVSSGNQRRP